MSEKTKGTMSKLNKQINYLMEENQDLKLEKEEMKVTINQQKEWIERLIEYSNLSKEECQNLFEDIARRKKIVEMLESQTFSVLQKYFPAFSS